MNQKSKKWILLCSGLICLIFSLYFSVYRFSSDNIDNQINQRPKLSFEGEDIQLSGWEQRPSGFVAVEQSPTITVQCGEKPVHVKNVRIDGQLKNPVTSVEVQFTDAPGAEFTKEQSLQAPVEIKNKNTYVVVDKDVCDLRLGVCREVGCEMELEKIVVNPRNININVQNMILIFLLPFSLILLAVEVIYNRNEFKKMITSLKKYRFLMCDLVSRDIKTKYRRSALGILWSVLNPLLMMLVLTAVFANIFRFEIDDFPVYYLTGYILFNFVQESTSFSMTSIINASGLIKKVYIPKIIFPLQKCIFSLVNLLFSLIAAVIVFLIVGVKPSWTMLLFFVPILFLFVFSFGFSLILATLNTFFRDVGYLYGVLLTVWMYLTPIIYPISVLPGWMQGIVRINPLFHYVEYFRAVTVYGIVPSLADNLICFAYALIFLVIGVVVFQKKQNEFIFYV